MMESIFDKLYFSFTGQKINTPDNFVPSPAQLYQAEILFTTLQRKEEYGTDLFDEKGRFMAEKSIMHLAGKSKKPMVDAFFDEIFPGAYASIYPYQCIPTFDIDHAYAFKGKGFIKNAGGMAKNIFSDRKRASARFNTWLNPQADPYDTYDYIIQTCKSFGLRPLFFIQMGNYGNGFDTNIHFKNPEGRKLIEFLAEHGDIGLHPSYASNTDVEILKREYDLLSEISGKSITKSRQHFLMLRFPETYRRLIDLGITEDYSMGWSSQIGFRASTSRPFLWYDLEKEEFTNLTVYPFPCMDGTLHEYMNLPVEEAIDEISNLVAETRRHQGVFVPLWHNHSVNDQWEWNGWQTVFEQMLALGCP